MTEPQDTDIPFPFAVPDADPPADSTVRSRAAGLLNLAAQIDKSTDAKVRDALLVQYVTESAEVITHLLDVILQQAAIIDDSMVDIIGVVNQHGRMINTLTKGGVTVSDASRIIKSIY